MRMLVQKEGKISLKISAEGCNTWANSSASVFRLYFHYLTCFFSHDADVNETRGNRGKENKQTKQNYNSFSTTPWSNALKCFSTCFSTCFCLRFSIISLPVCVSLSHTHYTDYSLPFYLFWGKCWAEPKGFKSYGGSLSLWVTGQKKRQR